MLAKLAVLAYYFHVFGTVCSGLYKSLLWATAATVVAVTAIESVGFGVRGMTAHGFGIALAALSMVLSGWICGLPVPKLWHSRGGMSPRKKVAVSTCLAVGICAVAVTAGRLGKLVSSGDGELFDPEICKFYAPTPFP
jgi:hypothetical protein